MHLTSVTLRNYRVHRELQVRFDRARTLIGGPNEAGKTTLIEAIHRALFFPAKSAAEPQRRMRSTLHSGPPEVEITFQARGRGFELKKRFSGASGTTTLIEIGGKTWHGEEAETQLAQLLGVPTEGTPKAATERWAHLWVWQGISGENPESHVTGQRDSLLARLQEAGGAAAMQSERDARVASEFAGRLEQQLTQAGKPKAGSELERAEAEAAEAALARTAAAERLARLQQAASDFEQATQAISQGERDLAGLIAEQTEIAQRLKRIAALQQQLELEQQTERTAAGRSEELRVAHARLAELERQAAMLREASAPQEQELARRDAARTERSRLAAAAEADASADAERLRHVHLRRELAEAQALGFEKRTELQQVRQRTGQARDLEQQLAAGRLSLAQLPAIDTAAVRKLQRIETELSAARSAFEAMAAGLQVLAADATVTAAGHPLAVGENRILTEETEVVVGVGTRLRIRPGGGTSLAEARAAVRQAAEKLQRALDGFGVGSVNAAIEVAARRDRLAATVKTDEARLADFDLPALLEKLGTLEEAVASAEARILRLGAELPGATAPADLSVARAASAAIEGELRETKSRESRSRTAAEQARQSLAEAEKAFEAQRKTCEEQARQLTALEAQLRLLVETQGEAGARARIYSAALLELESARRKVEAARAALEALQPALLAATANRLERAIVEKQRALQDAEKRKTVSQTLLTSDGTIDPNAELAQAEARHAFAQERLAAARRRVAALRLLNELFREEQRQLAERFTRPLADKISGYLQCVFGAGARAGVALRENAFCELQLGRGGQGAEPFDALSGGTREQVAAAVRLATAELLAEEHDGALPVVFDDAFAYSDPGRVRILQSMLDLAAERGLQLIILSCNPADYAGLGAAEITLAGRVATPVGAAGAASVVTPADLRTGTPAATITSDDTSQQLVRTVLRKAGGTKGQPLREELG